MAAEGGKKIPARGRRTGNKERKYADEAQLTAEIKPISGWAAENFLIIKICQTEMAEKKRASGPAKKSSGRKLN